MCFGRLAGDCLTGGECIVAGRWRFFVGVAFLGAEGGNKGRRNLSYSLYLAPEER